MQEVKLIAGLGNPGSEYKGTRHNAGFEVIDKLAGRFGVEVRKKKFGGCFGEVILGSRKLLLLKPGRYMNRSGEPVATAAGFYKLGVEDVMVVTDDMALEPGRIRIRAKGSAGGHNGLADIIAKFGTEEFARLRVGVGQSDTAEWADYVLSRPDANERGVIDEATDAAVEAVLCWVEQGTEAAMNRFNGFDAGGGRESEDSDGSNEQ